MLEAPEARLIASQLADTLTGKTIDTVIAEFTPHKFTFYNPEPECFAGILTGRIVTSARPVGGMVEIMAGDLSLVFTDGVNFRYIDPPGDLPRSHQLLLGFTDQSCLTASVRMYAGIICFSGNLPEGNLADYYQAAYTRPYVLSANFTREYFISLATEPSVRNKSAKAFLATGQRIPGLGNGVLQDILFYAGVNPKTKICMLSPEDLDKLYQSITGTLGTMVAQGGRDCETDIFGQKGGYRAVLSKETAGSECPVCGAVIIKENYMGGSIYFCPGCQPLNNNSAPRGKEKGA